jgi:hypothetical protein
MRNKPSSSASRTHVPFLANPGFYRPMSYAKLQAQGGEVMEKDEVEQQRIEDLLMPFKYRLQACYTHPANNCRNLLSLLITSTLAIRLLVLSQLGKKQRRSLKWPLTVEIFVYIRGTVPSELDRN